MLQKHIEKIILKRPHLSLSIAYGSRVHEGTIRVASWEKACGSNESLSVMPIGLKPFYCGFIYKKIQEKEMMRFRAGLIRDGVIWRDLISSDLLISMHDNDIAVYRGKKERYSPQLTRQLRDYYQDGKSRWSDIVADDLLSSVAHIPFFFQNKILRSITGKRSSFIKQLIRPVAETEKYVCVVADSDEIDATELVNRLSTRMRHWEYVYECVKMLGNVIVMIDENGVTILSEYDMATDALPHKIAAAKEYLYEYLRGFFMIAVISDLQLGADPRRDFFGHEKEIECIALVQECARRDATILINGDFLGLDLKKENTLAAITEQYPGLFASLRTVRRVVYVAGNHDDAVLGNGAVAAAVKKLLPNAIIVRNTVLVRGGHQYYFEHGHIQTGVYGRWYTRLLFRGIDGIHAVAEWIKNKCTGNAVSYPHTHLLYYVTRFLLRIPVVRQWPIIFFLKRELVRLLALGYVLTRKDDIVRTTVCCGHIHNVIRHDEGWVNMFLQSLGPQYSYINCGAWNASILKDGLFKDDQSPACGKKKSRLFDREDPQGKKDWVLIDIAGSTFYGSGKHVFLETVLRIVLSETRGPEVLKGWRRGKRQKPNPHENSSF